MKFQTYNHSEAALNERIAQIIDNEKKTWQREGSLENHLPKYRLHYPGGFRQ